MMSEKLAAITAKTKKNGKKNCNMEDTIAVQNVVDIIKKNTILKHPDYNLAFQLWTNASNHGI